MNVVYQPIKGECIKIAIEYLLVYKVTKNEGRCVTTPRNALIIAVSQILTFSVWPGHAGHDVIGPHLRLVLTRCPLPQHTVNRGYVYRQRFTAQNASPPVYYRSIEQ